MKMRCSRYLEALLCVVLVTLLFVPSATAQHKEKAGKPIYEIKTATLIPEGTSWAKELHNFNAEIQKRTGGEVRFRFWFGGVMGDEPDMIRKLRVGQVQAAALSGNGISHIFPDIRILESPFTFRTREMEVETDIGGKVKVVGYDYEQIDAVAAALKPYFTEKAREHGFEVLGFVEQGPIYLFSSKPIGSVEEIKKTKVWAWQNDFYAYLIFRSVGVLPVVMPVVDVLTGLRSGMLETFYNTAYLTIGLQWQNKVDYMVNMPLVNGTGMLLIDKDYFEDLPPLHRETVRTVARHYMAKFIKVSRSEHIKALGLLLGSGNIKPVKVPAAAAEEFSRIGADIRRKATTQVYDTGPFYDQSLLDTFDKVMAEVGGTR